MKNKVIVGCILLCSAWCAFAASGVGEMNVAEVMVSPQSPNAQTGPKTPSSSNDNYIGDCFHVFIPTQSADKTSVLNKGWYLTLSQDKDVLDVLRVKSGRFLCSSDDSDGEPVKVSAADMLKRGALRSGWVYGALALPYKYHLDDKSFSSETTVGPYVGRRSTLLGTSYIWALTAGLTPLRVDSTDQGGNKKSTTLLSFTYAAGLMFELNKGASPFRAGIFYGRDVVSSDSAVTYTHDRKNWVAFQLGYDFVAQ
ncbi:MAG: hypothetical protein WA632_11270 [Gallionella sp.]